MPTAADALPAFTPVPYTAWYRVWERTTPADFYYEMIMLPFFVLALSIHFWGVRRNRSKAKKFVACTQPILESEFALVGFGNRVKEPTQTQVSPSNLIEASAKLTGEHVSKDLLKEKTKFEFESYATGRSNTAFVDIKIYLWKWYNPLILSAEYLVGVFFPTFATSPERIEAISYAFDGQESDFVAPPVPGSEELGKVRGAGNSSYDPFIFAVVNKMAMRKLRDERYDLSLTFTKDNAKLPGWATVMSESAEVTDTMLTSELIKNIGLAEDYFEYLIITDQPIEKPTTVDEARPKKRVHICLRIPSDKDYAKVLPFFQTFIRLADYLPGAAKLRPEVSRKIKAARETEVAKLRKVAEKETEEERRQQMDKLKLDERNRKLKGLSPEEQKKFLEKEADKKRRKDGKKMTMKG